MSTLINETALRDTSALAQSFAAATPFPHVVIDDFLRADAADRIHEEARATVANVDASNVITQHHKIACTDWSGFGELTGRLIAYFNSALFVGPLEKISEIDGLIGDPWLEGGGIHMTSQGGFLKMHTDFNWHEKLRLDRRINILYYLNKNWRPEYGGELLIQRLRAPQQKTIEPIFNRLVIFNTNDETLHGHPNALAFPPDCPRLSIAMYYYTAGLPIPERIRGRSTTTRYLPRHRGDIELSRGSFRSRLGYLVRRFIRS
jgi:Rps23 Pro-64 3,4-dihydroxylase Tpa1-like proline 4-hydroxylase